jgi:hypothetical protein
LFNLLIFYFDGKRLEILLIGSEILVEKIIRNILNLFWLRFYLVTSKLVIIIPIKNWIKDKSRFHFTWYFHPFFSWGFKSFWQTHCKVSSKGSKKKSFFSLQKDEKIFTNCWTMTNGIWSSGFDNASFYIASNTCRS